MKTTYIIAVSGGVDSVVLLHKLASVKPPNVVYVVAHVDHGIRSDSALDANFVSSIASNNEYMYESVELKLGLNASEEQARELRYEFLFKIMKKYKAEGIITAHHQDDVVETMIINMLRGTTARGLIGYTNKDIIRPFISKTKDELLNYATEHKLTWREDSTNSDSTYLRNEVRLSLMPKLKKADRKMLIEIRKSLVDTYQEMDSLTRKLLVQTLQKSKMVRSRFVVLPYKVQLELMATWLRLNDITLEKKLVERAVLNTKVLLPGKHVELTKHVKLISEKSEIVLHVEPQDV